MGAASHDAVTTAIAFVLVNDHCPLASAGGSAFGCSCLALVYSLQTDNCCSSDTGNFGLLMFIYLPSRSVDKGVPAKEQAPYHRPTQADPPCWQNRPG